MHLLVFLKTDHTFLTPQNVDRLISAELPDENTAQGKELGDIVKSAMVHRQCAGGNTKSICMKAIAGRHQVICSTLLVIVLLLSVINMYY